MTKGKGSRDPLKRERERKWIECAGEREREREGAGRAGRGKGERDVGGGVWVG